MTLTAEDGNQLLKDNFAPWVLDLGLAVESVDTAGVAVVRLPWSARLARQGGGLSGQAMMAAADTATVLAVSAARGGFVPMTTVQQSISFQRPVQDADVLITATVSKLGRTLAFVDIELTVDGASDPAAKATTVYAIAG
jgi:uncharacterized protein (TIGR00369 family)